MSNLKNSRRLLLFMDFDAGRKSWNGWREFQKLKKSQLKKIRYLFNKWLDGHNLGHDEYHTYDQEYPNCASFKMIQFKMRFHGFLYSIVSPGMNLQVCILTHHEVKKEDAENATILSAIADFRASEFDVLELERFLRLR